MREILFRGKTPEGEWVEGLIGAVFTADENRKPILRDFIEFDCLGWTSHTYVYDETVGQYTGLTDKNGKQIFEGDLLNGFQYPFLNDNAHNYFAEVVWLENSTAFGLYTHKHPLSAVRGLNEGCDYMEDFDSSQWEIIGNIHDNPELLKGGVE